MKDALAPRAGAPRRAAAVGLVWLCHFFASATDWPQYRGPTTDGISPDPISTQWPANGPTVVWRNDSLTNGFSCVAVSQGRAFTLISRDDGGGSFFEYCVAVDAATGTNIWATSVDSAPWDPSVAYNGGDGSPPYNTGDGPRTTPSVNNGRVIALSGQLRLVCMNATNGLVLWNVDLVAAYGASIIPWENAASPCLDNDLIFVNLHTATNNQTLAAFRLADGTRAWSSQNENVTHTTPVIATIQGVRQVIFATRTGLVALDRTTGAFLWKFTYPFAPISTSMGASPVVYSNIVFCTAAYGRGAAAAQITLTNSTWTVTQLYYKNNSAGASYRSIWMTPVCYQGYIYTLCGENSTFLTTPLSCIELSTGNLKWTTNNFGMGGLILVNTNLLVLTEDGQLVLVKPNSSAYTELARYRAFQFSGSAPGKCWISPAYSNGRIYAHSTREGISVDVSVPPGVPDLTTVGASNVTSNAATLYGNVNPNGAATSAWFQWGLTSSYGSNTPATINLTGTSPLGVSNALSGLTPGTTYHFRITATNSAGTTNGTDLTFATSPPGPTITTQPRSRAAVVGASASFSVSASSPPTNSYQWRFFGTNVLSGQTNATLTIANVQGTNFGDYTVVVSNSFGSITSVVASLTLAIAPLISSATITLNAFLLTFASEFGPTYFIDYKDILKAPAWLPFTNIVGTGSAITIIDNDITKASRFYRIRLQAPLPPIITTQPRSRAAIAGASASFNVVATSPSINSYQWCFFGTNVLAGQTNTTLNIANVQPTNFGNYTVVVTNSFGSVTSAVASLTRAIAPLITSATLNLDTFFLTFASEFGPTYFIDYKDTLTAPAWLPFTNMAGTGLPTTISDHGLTNGSRFYRIHLQ